jgi:hypothetical protein
VREIRTEFAIKYVSKPVIAYDATIAGYLYGSERRFRRPTPYVKQRDLPGFVKKASTDEILAREELEDEGLGDVPAWPHLTDADRQAVFTRTRSKAK